MKLFNKIGLGLGLGLSALSASAAVDVTAVVAEIDSAVPAVVAIGSAVLIVAVSAKVYKWVRGAM